MAGRLKFLFLYFLSWIFFFELARLIFLFYYFPLSKQLTFSTAALSFLYGLRMDVSMGAYILIPVCLFVLAGIFLPFFQRSFIYKLYTFIVLFLILLVVLSDLGLYREWGFRIDATPLRYLNSPNEVWATISHLPLLLITIIFIAVYLSLCFLWKVFIWKICSYLPVHENKIGSTIVILACTFFLIVPIRGGFQLSPMNQSSVYFSKNNFANILAVNAPWNFLHSLVFDDLSSKNKYRYMDDQKAKEIVDSLYSNLNIRFPVFKTQNPNVIVIIWESFTEKATHEQIDGRVVAPRFNELKKEGIYFTHAYASGDRTDKGLAAVLSGYPAMNNVSILRFPGKSLKLNTLGSFFKEKKYRTSFYYGGESEFANIKSYVLQSHYDKLIDKNEFATKDQNSKWGAHDGVVGNKILNDLNKEGQPFFCTWLTLSSHEPFEVPQSPFFNGSSDEILFANSLHYTDESLYQFIAQCKQQAWWNNTVVIITADHGHPLLQPSSRLDNFKIPVLWLGGALNQTGIEINKYCSQLDIAASLSMQVGAPKKYFPFSKNLFDSTSGEWAYFSFNDGFGFVQPSKAFVFDNVGKQIIQQIGAVQQMDINKGQAMQQFSYGDYLRK